MNSPLQVVIYGASLFLTAIASSLHTPPNIHVEQVHATPYVPLVISQPVDVVLWEQNRPPPNQTRLLKTGYLLVQANGQTSTFVLQHRTWQQPYHQSIGRTADLITLLLKSTVTQTARS